MRYVYLIAWAAFSLASTAQAEDVPVFRADVSCSTCGSYGDVLIDVQDGQRNSFGPIAVGSNGAFELRRVPEGTYMVTLRTPSGQVLHREMLNISRRADHVTIQVPDDGAKAERPASGTVSYARLKHKVPKDAHKLYVRSTKASHKGDIQTSIAYLKQAIEIDPEFMEAINDLGTRYMGLDDPKTALQYFRRASELDPGAAPVEVNVGIALLTLRDFPEAETAARRAIGLDPADLKARFLLGIALYQQKKFTDEMIDQLKRVQDVFPSARIAMATAQANRGDLDIARTTLQEYLKTGDKSRRKEAESLLARMK